MTVSGTTTDYFYVGADLIAEKTGSTWKDYIFFAGQRMAEQTGSTAASAIYLHTDHLGSTRRCTDASGGSAGTCDYEPFGENQPGTSCSVPTRFRFAGMDFDANTNFYHTQFREYDPNQGRWMSVDPLPGSEDDPQSRNRYVYVLNDPANLTDPLGLHTCPEGYMHAIKLDDGSHFCLRRTPTLPREGGSIDGGGGDLYAIVDEKLDDSDLATEIIDASIDAYLTAKSVNQCASQLSQSLNPRPGNFLSDMFFGNQWGTFGRAILGPDREEAVGKLALKNPVPYTSVVGIVSEIVKGTPTGGATTSIGVPISSTPGTYNPVSVGQTATTVGTSRLGGASFRVLTGVAAVKAVVDAGVYVGALWVCSK
ncbi:MAG: hypothetical protein M1453_00395 [Acidobacteria bacterium]|nr:hypothetical protein [Acidobacteriota bacterium]